MSEVILAMSACRTTITEVYQTGGTAPLADQWGCGELGGGGTPIVTKYMSGLSTDVNGVVTATVNGINSTVNGMKVTLTPLVGAGVKAKAVTGGNMGEGLFGWVCGSTGTDLDKKYLPGSCRGQ
jgi:type IV pilus assembly protein PilA